MQPIRCETGGVDMRVHHTPNVSSRTDARHEVQEFLDRFARALTAGDGKTIAKMWEVPAFVLSADTAMPIASIEEVEKFFSGAKAQYNERGIVNTRGDIVDCEPIGE